MVKLCAKGSPDIIDVMTPGKMFTATCSQPITGSSLTFTLPGTFRQIDLAEIYMVKYCGN